MNCLGFEGQGVELKLATRRSTYFQFKARYAKLWTPYLLSSLKDRNQI